MGMGKKFDALFRRSFKTSSKLKTTLSLSFSRLNVLRNQRQARCSLARSDVVQLLNLGHHERALLRVELVIKEQNMLDVFAMIEGYCLLLTERLKLLEEEKVCPDELKEAISSLIYAATRCGDFPELQEMRTVFTSRFGKEFTTRAVELRNNCGVNPKMIQKLSTRMPLENRLKVLKEIASENHIVLQIEDVSSATTELLEKSEAKQKQDRPIYYPPAHLSSVKLEENKPILPGEIVRVDCLPHSMEARTQYRDVADAALAAFESAAYAAAAARAAVELFRSKSHDPNDHHSPYPEQRKVAVMYQPMKSKLQTGEEEDIRVGLGFEKMHSRQTYFYDSEDEEMQNKNQPEEATLVASEAEFTRSLSSSSSDSADNILNVTKFPSDFEGHRKTVGRAIVFDESDDETQNARFRIPLARTGDSVFGANHTSMNEVFSSKKSKTHTVKYEDLPERSGAKLYHPFYDYYPFRSQAAQEEESGEGNTKPCYFPEGWSAHHLNAENRPISARTTGTYGR